MDRRYNARQVLGDLVGKTIQTLTGRPNTVLALEGDAVRVATERSPEGALVPVDWVQEALDRLTADGEIESVGYRSTFVGAVLASLEDRRARRRRCGSSA